jgi:hypothetical protein
VRHTNEIEIVCRHREDGVALEVDAREVSAH